MTRESDETGRPGWRARCGREWAVALLVPVMAAAYQVQALAEPVYYVLGQQTSEPTKYDSAKAACDAYRDYVQASNDGPNPGGVAIVKKYPREDLYPSLKMSDYCIVNWSRWSSSFDYWLSVYAGGCLPGRRPKDNAPKYFAEPGDCEPPPCPVLPLKPLPPDDYCARSLEAGKGKDVYGACSIALTPAMKQQARCLANKIGALNIPYGEPESTVRSAAYQAHFKEIWKSWQTLKNLQDPALIQACAARWAEIDGHKRWHGIKGRPAKKRSAHEDGNAIDIDWGTVAQLGLVVTGDSSYDIQEYIQDPSVNPPACNLLWGGRFSDYDPVHFQTPQ